MRAYELGRWRVAARAALVVPLLVLTVAWETGHTSSVLVLGGGLTAVAVGLRWWHRRRSEGVSVGLLAGLIPLATTIAVCRVGLGCSVPLSLGLCTVAGLVAGVIVARYAGARVESGRIGRWLTAVTVAGLTGSLGCGAVSTAALVGILLGLIAGGALDVGLERVATATWGTHR